MKITFGDVREKYQQSHDLIDASMNFLKRDNPLDISIYAPWVHLPTLARWLNGSSQDSLTSFRSMTKEFLDSPNSSHINTQDSINIWDIDLSTKVFSFRNKLLMVFGTNDKNLKEALSK